jgi:ferredoxin-NADP reductase
MPVFSVRRVDPATPRTRLLTIDFSGHPFQFTAGQAVLVGLEGSTNRKPYSIASAPQHATQMGAFELLVQIEDATAPDPHLELAVAGTALVVDGPFGSFSLPSPLHERDLLFIAGGTGIAPLRSIIGDVLERHPNDDGVRVALIYSARAVAELAFRDELTRLALERRLRLHLTTTREAAVASSTDRSIAPIHRGRITEPVIRGMLRTPETRCLVCGPPPLVADATAILRAIGVSAERILTESYAG